MHSNSAERVRLHRQRIKVKRVLSKIFDKEFKRKKNQSQAKWRQKKKQEQQQLRVIPPPPSAITNKTMLRKKEGQQRRHINTSKLKNENESLRRTVRQLTLENEKLKAQCPQTPPRLSPAKLLLKNVSPSATIRAVMRLKDQKDNLSRGSNSQFRKQLGINLSVQNQSKNIGPSKLESDIEQFFCQDNVSKLCPDKKKVINGGQVRHRLNHLYTLHQWFENETKIDIDYSTFTRHIPPYIQKPSHESWGTCLCVTCLNPQMKYEKLKQMGHKNSTVKSIMNGTPVDLSEIIKNDDEIGQFKNNLSLLGAYYFEHHVSLLTGYVWLKNNSFSFGCISDDTNHMAEATWTAISDLLQDLIQNHDVTTLNFISDSPVSQYRNKTTIYFMTKYAQKEEIGIKWVYLESGHGKGVADAVGAALKRQFDEAISFDPDHAFDNAQDLMNAVQNNTDIKLYIYDKKDIQKLKDTIPALSTIKGTAKFHEVLAKKRWASLC
ncbi:unnamed protein product [Rotaria sordida]|uniref:Uncharacterized protein n=3 Tax=Rotaria sordida TaxID=392033 RepID=A0A819MTW8_9BILA|nr:unnamed protein product [Rotaria sordida]